MGRKRTPCEFCEGDWATDYKDHRNGYCLWAEIYPFNNLISVIAQANDEEGELIEDYISINMNYCPVCGRRLETM